MEKETGHTVDNIYDCTANHAQIQKVLSEVIQIRQSFFLTFFFKLVGAGGGGQDPKPTKSTTWVRQQNAIYMAFRWRVDDGPTLNAGLVAL